MAVEPEITVTLLDRATREKKVEDIPFLPKMMRAMVLDRADKLERGKTPITVIDVADELFPVYEFTGRILSYWLLKLPIVESIVAEKSKISGIESLIFVYLEHKFYGK